MSAPKETLFTLRKRTGWESADAGILLWRSVWKPLVLFTAAPIAIVAAILCVITGDYRMVTLVLWWLKPLFDRFALHIVSVRFFEQKASVRRLFKGLGRTLVRGIAGDLLWRRFSPVRSGTMPIRVLEYAPKKTKTKQQRRSYRSRKQALKGGNLNFCAVLTIFGMGMEGLLFLGEIYFAHAITTLTGFNTAVFYEGSLLTRWVLLIAYICNYVIIETLYVCMGFSLYINSRVEVEGWDIQVLFHKFASVAPTVSGLAKALAVCFMLGAAVLPQTYAAPGEVQDVQKVRDVQEPPVETLNEILSDKDFGGTTEGRKIRLRRPPEKTENPDIKIAPWLEVLHEVVTQTLRVLLALVIVAVVVLVVWRIRKMTYQPAYKRKKGGELAGFSMAVDEDAAVLLEKAKIHYARQHIREAWAYCLASAIVSFRVTKHISFPLNATEYECLSLVRKLDGESARDFALLVGAWVYLAYAGVAPEPDAFASSCAFCGALLEAAHGK